MASDTVSDGTHGISDRENGTRPPLPMLPRLMPLSESPGESEHLVASEEKTDEEESEEASDAD